MTDPTQSALISYRKALAQLIPAADEEFLAKRGDEERIPYEVRKATILECLATFDAAIARGQPHIVKVWASGGMSGASDFLMSDGSIKTLSDKERDQYRAPPQALQAAQAGQGLRDAAQDALACMEQNLVAIDCHLGPTRRQDWVTTSDTLRAALAAPPAGPGVQMQDTEVPDAWYALYATVNHLMCKLGADGEISTRSQLVDDVMNALHDIDGGNVDAVAFEARVADLQAKGFMPHDQAAALAFSEQVGATPVAQAAGVLKQNQAEMSPSPAPLGVPVAMAESLFQHIKHGDEKHREWLRTEALKWAHDYFTSPPTQPLGLPDAQGAPDCHCLRCDTERWDETRAASTDPFASYPPDCLRMYVCVNCGNKRCPQSDDHRNACSGSNEPGQLGSRYPKFDSRAAPAGGKGVAL